MFTLLIKYYMDMFSFHVRIKRLGS